MIKYQIYLLSKLYGLKETENYAPKPVRMVFEMLATHPKFRVLLKRV
jgi:hypothetical protein